MRPPNRLGPYVELAPLGKGGMGTVYTGRHEELGALRALKVLGSGAGERQQARFLREARTLARLRHKNLVTVHEAGVAEGLLYYAMDRIEGRSLAEVLAEGRLDFTRARELALELCEGVAALHAAGVVHRDLKPDNVMVTPEGRPVVIDLGLALSVESDTRLTRTGALVGTVSYMAPEQVRDSSSVDARADVYALGLILFELFSGASAAPAGETMPEVVSSILHGERPRLREQDPALPAPLDELLARTLAPDPAQRPADADALWASLRELQGAAAEARAEQPVWALALVTLGLFLLVGALAWRTAPGEPPPPTPTPTPSAQPVRPPLSELEREPDPARRLARLLELERQAPRHPERARLSGLIAQARWQTPLRAPAQRHDGGCFLSDERLLTGGAGTGLVNLWRLREGGLEREESWSRDVRYGRAGIAPVGSLGVGFVDGSRWHVVSPAGELIRSREGYNRWHMGRLQARTGVEVGVKVSYDRPGSAVVVNNMVELRRPGEQPEAYFMRELIACFELTPDGKHMVFGTRRGLGGQGTTPSLRLLRLADAEAVGRLNLLSEALCLALSPDGEWAAVGGRLGQLFLARVQPLQLTRTFASGTPYDIPDRSADLPAFSSSISIAHRYFVLGAAFAAEGRLLYSAGTSEDYRLGSFAVWEVASGEELFRAELGYGARGLALSPRGDRLALFGQEQIEVRRIPTSAEEWRALSRAEAARSR
ncbi:MAG TPA: hypothetical protein DEA08_33600 [Planctomycetes bacterium]|nr:hypothetical protein [Planctomycetota bacterium]